MNKIKKIGIVAVLALALTLSSAAPAVAGLTLDTTSVVSGGALTLNGAATSAITLGGTQTTGTMSIATGNGDQTIDVATGTGAKAINIGTNATGIKTIKIGDNDSPSNVITIGGAASTITVGGPMTLDGTTATGLTLSGTNSTAAIDITGAGTVATGIDIGTAVTGLTFTGAYTTAAIQVGTEASDLVLGAADDHAIDVWTTNAVATAATVRSVEINQTHTGAGVSRAEALTSILTSNVAMGSWSNAIFGKIDLSTSGAVTGLAGVVCAELALPGSDSASGGGEYSVYEAEINCPGSCDMGSRPIHVFEVNAWWTNVAQFDTVGYLLDIDGVTSGTGKFWNDPTIRIKFDDTTKYLITSGTENKLDLGDSSDGIDIGTATTGIALTGDMTTGIDITSSVTATNAISIAGANVNGINISGNNTGAGITIATSDTGINLTGDYATAAIQLGTSGDKMSLAEHGDHAIDINTTSPSTDAGNSVRPLHMVNTMTGTGGVGGRAEFEMNTEKVLGGWANALKGYTDFGTDGSVTGLGSGICAEMRMPAKTLAAGNYAPLEIELVLQETSRTGGFPVSFMHAQASQASSSSGLDDFIDNGYVMSLQGLGAASAGHVFDEIGSVTPTHQLRILIGGTPYFIMLQATQ